MFDKVRSGAVWGTVTAIALPLLANILNIEAPQDADAEDTVVAVLLALVPVLVGWVAAYLKREKTGYGATTTVVTTGAAPQPAGGGASYQGRNGGRLT